MAGPQVRPPLPAALLHLLLLNAALPRPATGSQLRRGAGLLRNRNEAHVYDYSGHGQDWLMGSCGSRTRQSPIDFPPMRMGVPPSDAFRFSYQRLTSPFNLKNTGHTLSAELRGLGYGGINYGGAWFELLFINVHALSEHTFNGQHWPGELHLVHKRYDSDALLVVAVPLDSASPPPLGGTPLPAGGAAYQAPPAADPNFAPLAQLFLRVAPPATMMQVAVPGDELDAPRLNDVLGNATFYGYAGSLTAPPCSETAVWLVRSSPLLVSDTQLRYLQDVVMASTEGLGNYRSVMPLEGREIRLYAAIRDDAPELPVDAIDALAPKPVEPDQKYRSMKWAKDALRVARASLDYVQSLDARLSQATQVAASRLAPNVVRAVQANNAAGNSSTTPGPQAAAQAMAATVAEAARVAIDNATKRIAEETHQAAIEAAKNATKMVLESLRRHDQQVEEARATAAFGR